MANSRHQAEHSKSTNDKFSQFSSATDTGSSRNARNATLRWQSRFVTTTDCCVQERVLEPRFNKELKEKTKSTQQQIAHARECVMKRKD